jgi:hypothetical protein
VLQNKILSQKVKKKNLKFKKKNPFKQYLYIFKSTCSLGLFCDSVPQCSRAQLLREKQPGFLHLQSKPFIHSLSGTTSLAV